MRIRNNKNADKELSLCNRYISSKEELDKVLEENRSKRINLEIGMGKGEFIINSAFRNDDEIFIGVEICKSVLALAIKKLNRFEEEKNMKFSNLYFMSFDAKDLLEYFDNNSIDKIFLNFSDPWPKKRHEKRRLTHENFLKLYKEILKDDSFIEFKTDNRGLFEYSLESMNNFGMVFKKVYLDLHKTDVINIMTEYERKFSISGPIYKVECKF